MGVKSPKKIIPITIGLTIFPRSNPKAIHNLLRGLSNSAWISATAIKRTDVIAKPYKKTIDSIRKKYAARTAKMKAKKNPN